MTRNGISLTAALIAHIFAWAATLFLLFGPVYMPSGETLVEVNGIGAALLTVVPVALTAGSVIATLPSAAYRRLLLVLRWMAVVLLLAFCGVSALSIGVLYLPAAIAALVAAIVRRP